MKNKIIFNTDSNFVGSLTQKHRTHWLLAGTIMLQSDMHGWSLDDGHHPIVTAAGTYWAITMGQVLSKYFTTLSHLLLTTIYEVGNYHPYFIDKETETLSN